MQIESLKHKAIKGVLWSAIDRFSSQGIAFILSIILARLLTPHDYGLIAMTGIFISISQAFIDSGLSSALVRKKDRTETDLSTAFFINIIIGTVCYFILYGCAPFISQFYGEEKLCNITRIMGIIFFLFSFSNVQQAVLTIRIDFKTKTKISLISVLLSGGIGIALAFYGMGVWALVVQQVAVALIKTIMLWLLVKWRPLCVFSISSFRSMFSFGSKMLATGLLNSIFNNLSTIIIGKTYSAGNLGYYSRAEQFAQFPSINITNIIKSVMFPSMALIQDEEKRFKNNFYNIQELVTFAVFPLIIGLASVSFPLISLLLSDKWIHAANLLQIICFGLMWYPVYTQNLNIMEVKGHGGYVLKSETLSKSVNVVVLIATLPFGLETICWGQVMSNIMSVLISNHYITKTIGEPYCKLFFFIGRNLLYSLIMGLISHYCQFPFMLPESKLLSGIIVGFLSYALLNFLFNRKFLITFLKTFIKR